VPLTLARMPRDADFAVIEIGMNHPGEIAPLARMARPHLALVTTVAAAHLEAFESIEDIAREKASLFEGLEPGGTALVNADISTAAILRETAMRHAGRVIGFGTARGAHHRLLAVDLHDGATVARARAWRTPLLYKIGVTGRHFALKGLAVRAAVRVLGLDRAVAIADLANWSPPEGRGTRERLVLDLVADGMSIDLLDAAFNANPESMAAALEVLAASAPRNDVGRLARGRRIAILGDMLELGATEAALRGIKGVSGAACRIVGEGSARRLVAYVTGAPDLCETRLREALVAAYRARGGARARPSIALVARPGDAQIGELRRLAAHLRQMGHRAENLVPAECEPEAWDVLYRHVWAHRVDPADPFARALRAPGRYVLLNPVNGLLEAKALFARLSECAEDAALAERAGLDAEERAAAGRLPWTRRLTPEVAARLVAERERFVLKRSWDYGGKSVHLGAETAPEAWARAVEEALADPRGGGWVAQERVFAVRRPATRIAPEGVSRADLYRDVSTYCGLGPSRPSGSVVRAAASPVVNILGGGGLAPVIPEDVMEALR
jgi:hypothetical protein